MTAGSDGKQIDEGPAMSSVLERPAAPAARRPRPLDEIFPLQRDANRGRQMQETWHDFGVEMAGTVEAALVGGRSPPEIAYAIGEIVHNYFRTRGVTLTSYELRRLVAELLVQQERGRRSPAGGPLVQFAGEPPATTTSWTGADAAASPPAVADAA